MTFCCVLHRAAYNVQTKEPRLSRVLPREGFSHITTLLHGVHSLTSLHQIFCKALPTTDCSSTIGYLFKPFRKVERVNPEYEQGEPKASLPIYLIASMFLDTSDHKIFKCKSY